MSNRTTRKTNRTKVEDLRPFAKVVLEHDGSIAVEDNFPDTYEGRLMTAQVLYGAFQAVANEAARIAPKVILPSEEDVERIAPKLEIARR